MNLVRRTAWTLATLALLVSPSAFAEKFANQFTEFELPPSWNCALEGAEWVCQNTNELKKKEAIIVLAAKLKGDNDSLDQYMKYLNSVKSFTAVNGKPLKSLPKYTKTNNLNGQVWADSLHLESEIPGFYTRYLATVKDDIGVLITYSIAKDKYQSYLPEFENMVRTLKVFRKPGGMNENSGGNFIADAGKTQQNVIMNDAPPVAGHDDVTGGADQQPQKKAASLADDPTLLMAVGALALIGFFLFKKRKG